MASSLDRQGHVREARVRVVEGTGHCTVIEAGRQQGRGRRLGCGREKALVRWLLAEARQRELGSWCHLAEFHFGL